jgi:hypothetical protein
LLISFKNYLMSTIILILINVHCVNAQKSAIEIVGDIALFAMPIAAISTTFIKTWQFTNGFLLSQDQILAKKCFPIWTYFYYISKRFIYSS